MIPWTVVNQAPLLMGFSRQQYWSGLPFPSPGDLSNPGIEPVSPALAGGFFTIEPCRKCQALVVKNLPDNAEETLVQSLSWEDPLQEGMATHSSILDWRIP